MYLPTILPRFNFNNFFNGEDLDLEGENKNDFITVYFFQISKLSYENFNMYFTSYK